jgi:hypothetical protein
VKRRWWLCRKECERRLRSINEGRTTAGPRGRSELWMGLRERQRGAGETARDGSEERRRSAGWVGRGAAELTPSTQSRGPDARPRRAQAPGTLVSSDTLIGRSLVPSAALFLCDFGGLFSGNESRSLSPADATPRRPSDTTPCGRIGHIVHHPTVLLRLSSLVTLQLVASAHSLCQIARQQVRRTSWCTKSGTRRLIHPARPRRLTA